MAVQSAKTDIIVRANVVGTVAFVITATIAAIWFSGPLRVTGVVVALILFAIGVFTFLSSYWTAVQRSRTDEIAVSQLYFLGGKVAPGDIKRVMNTALLVQVLVGLVTALSRPSTNGKSGSTLAFGVLVPMFGLGLNGLWAARNGSFSARLLKSGQEPTDAKVVRKSRPVHPSPNERGQNANHG